MGKKKRKNTGKRRRSAPRKPKAEPAATNAPSKLDFVAIAVANFLILGTLIYVVVIRRISSDFYYLSVQEDEYLEWGSFWAFAIAAGVLAVAALRQRRATAPKPSPGSGRAEGAPRAPAAHPTPQHQETLRYAQQPPSGQLPWFLLGVSLFCFVVAMEEISWAQRLFSYRPPTYFLANNFQQELNVHNVISTSLRKLLFKSIILGYGVFLPLLAALAPAARKLMTRAAIVTPPLALAPSFFAAFLVYDAYPWSYSGEWVELMVGLGFLFVGLFHVWDFDDRERRPPRLAAAVAVAWLLIVGLGVATAALSRSARVGRPELLEAARVETEALKNDFLSGKGRISCNNHKRLYTFKEKYGADGLLEGEFAALTAQGMPEERADFFLDPWNYPYWIRDRCRDSDRVRMTFVYSFGPNQLRDSTRWKILGDDIGAIIYQRGID